MSEEIVYGHETSNKPTADIPEELIEGVNRIHDKIDVTIGDFQHLEECIFSALCKAVNLGIAYSNTDKTLSNINDQKWWNFIKPEDMPEYVKDNVAGRIVIKVHKWVENEDCFISDANKDIGHKSRINIFVPATKEEYEAYIKRNKTNGNS